MDICDCAKKVKEIEAWGSRYAVKDFIVEPGSKASYIEEDLHLVTRRGGEPARIIYEDGSTKGSEEVIVDGVDAITAFVELLITAECQTSMARPSIPAPARLLSDYNKFMADCMRGETGGGRGMQKSRFIQCAEEWNKKQIAEEWARTRPGEPRPHPYIHLIKAPE